MNNPSLIPLIAALITATATVYAARIKEKKKSQAIGIPTFCLFVVSLFAAWYILRDSREKCAHMLLSNSRQALAAVLNTVKEDISHFPGTNIPPYILLKQHGETIGRAVATAKNENDSVRNLLPGAADRDCIQMSISLEKIDRAIVDRLESADDKSSREDLLGIKTTVISDLSDAIKGLSDK